MPTPLLTRQRVLAAKIETTPGTAETLLAANAAFNVFDPKYTTDVGWNKREGQSALSRRPGVSGARAAKMSFAVDLVGDGAGGIPSWASTFLPMCGWAATGNVFKPVTGSTTTGTLAQYVGGVRKLIHGAMGTFKIDLNAGNPGRVMFDFTGCFNLPTDAALLAPTYPVIIPPRFASATLTVGALTPVLKTLSIDAGNKVILREDATKASGYLAAHITDREVVGKIDPEASLVATYDAYTLFLAGTEVALSATIGSTLNQIVIAIPKMQYAKVDDGDRNGLLIHDADFQANRSADAGDDECTLTFA